MTPEELRRLAEEWHECCGDIHVPLLAAADALEAAWAERDDAIANAVDNYNDAERWRERAEQAEAERDDQIRQAEIQAHRALDAETALARVRDLCDEDPIEWALAGADMAERIRAAIDGDQ